MVPWQTGKSVPSPNGATKYASSTPKVYNPWLTQQLQGRLVNAHLLKATMSAQLMLGGDRKELSDHREIKGHLERQYTQETSQDALLERQGANAVHY